MSADRQPWTVEQLTHELVDELARVFWEADRAQLLAARAGFPRQHLPDFRTPYVFWSLVVRAAYEGTLDGGVPALVAEAARQYPNHDAFRDHERFSRLLSSREPDDHRPDTEVLRSSCAELLAEGGRSPAGMAQAIAPTMLLTCAHSVAAAETVRLRPWSHDVELEATVIRGSVDVALDVALLHCPRWPQHGSISPISRQLPAVGARVMGFPIERSADPDRPETTVTTYDGSYFGLGDGRHRVTVRGPSWHARHVGMLLYDGETHLAWGLAVTAAPDRREPEVGNGLRIVTPIDAVLERCGSYLGGVDSREPPALARHQALAERGWALLWRTGSRATKRAVHQHLPFFVKGDAPSPDDIARGEAYPRRAAKALARFLSPQVWESPRFGIISGQRGDGKTTLALLAARMLHEQGTQILLHRGSGEPDLGACAKLVDAAPVLFVVERPRTGTGWYQHLSDHLAEMHATTGHAADILLIDPPLDVLQTEYKQIMDDMRGATPARLYEISAAPTVSEIDPRSLYEHVKGIYADRSYACELELASPFEILRDVDTSRALLRGVFAKLSAHAGIPPAPLHSRPPWLTPSLTSCVTLTSSVGLTLPWALARNLTEDLPAAPGEGEWASIGWDETGLRYGHSEQARRPWSPELGRTIEQLLALALHAGDSEFAGALTLALLRDPVSHDTTQRFILGHLAHALETPQPGYAQMLWSTYLLCTNADLRRLIVDISLCSPASTTDEYRRVFAKILFADTWRTFREATKSDPGARITSAMRADIVRVEERLEALAAAHPSEDVESYRIQTAAILYVIDLFVPRHTELVPDTSAAHGLDDFWSMALGALEFLTDESTAKHQLVAVIEALSLPSRGPGVHERLARVLFKLYRERHDRRERQRILELMERCALSGVRSTELHAATARALYMEHLDVVRRLRPRRSEALLGKLEALYFAEPGRQSLRFQLLGALVNAHRSAIHRSQRREAARLITYALTVAHPDDPPEFRSRLSVALYNAHRDAIGRRAWSDTMPWLMQLRQLGEREDAMPRSPLLHRRALENALFALRDAPSESTRTASLMEAYQALLPVDERGRAAQLIAELEELHDWAALGDARWETIKRDPPTLVDSQARRASPDFSEVGDSRDGTDPSHNECAVSAIRRHLQSGSIRREACLVVIYGAELGRKYDVEGSEVTIGRATTSDIRVGQSSVSRTHARIVADHTGVRILDNASTNGTQVNDRRIHETYLKNGDIIEVGHSIFKFLTGNDIQSAYHEEIYRLSTIDVLTQVHNKRYFIDALERELSRARRHDRPLALMMIAIDDLARCNDTFGYRAGDHVLRQVAKLIRDGCRKLDVVARYGGEVFAVALPELEPPAAGTLAEATRETVERARFELGGHLISITVSVGVAELEPHMANATGLTEAVEVRLARARSEGGNRVVVSDREGPSSDGSEPGLDA